MGWKDVWDRRLAGDKNPPKFLTVREVLGKNFFQGGGGMRSPDLLCAASHRPPALAQ
jgi:hypothetical protein